MAPPKGKEAPAEAGSEPADASKQKRVWVPPGLELGHGDMAASGEDRRE